MFGRLVAYKQKYGDCLVPRSYGDKQLATWVTTQRWRKTRSKLEVARIQRLNELGFVWIPRDDYWEEMFGRLVAYKQQHGDCQVPRRYSDEQLASWVSTQRLAKNRGKLESAREQRLNELEFVWEPQDDAWEEMLGRLVAYKQQHGDCPVPRNVSDKQLATWVGVQRTVKSRGKLEAARIQRLEEVGIVWEPQDDAWEEMFDRLVVYKQQYGDCLVPQSYSDKQLATWVVVQRRGKNQGRLEAARIHRLEELGFVWDPHDESWEDMFGRLVAYKQKYGDCLVPRSYGDKQFATWISRQRTGKKTGKLDAAREQRLNELEFVWKVRR